MNTVNAMASILTPKTFMDSMIRLGLIVILAFACFRVVSPFVILILWALMLAIVLYPLHQRIAKRIGGRQGLAATLMVIAACLLIDPPLVLLGESFVTEGMEFMAAYENGEVAVPQPDPGVSKWPIIGERLYNAWNEAATNLPRFLETHAGQIHELGLRALAAAKNTVGLLFLFFGAFIIAGIMMAFGRQGSNAMQRISCTLAGPVVGPQMLTLTVATVRSVTMGVLGVAFIQALLFGVGFVLAGVPAAGLLALIVMFIGIIQLPAIIVALPAIIYVWVSGDGSVGANIFYTAYFLIAGVSDNVLKPLLLGRGVEAPMPVILIGAIGGLIMGGLIGLFLGAILLAVGYQIFMKWVATSMEHPELVPGTTDPVSGSRPDA